METREEIQKKTDETLKVFIVFTAICLIVGIILMAGVILVLEKAI